MDFHAFMYATIGRRHELERGMAGKDPVLYQRMLDEIAEYARTCDATGCKRYLSTRTPAVKRLRGARPLKRVIRCQPR